MEWTCPHCSTGLSVSDSNLGNTWSFARCYQCKNFSLINKLSPQNIIRVDTPPESGQSETVTVSESQNLVEKPVIKPAARKISGSSEQKEKAELTQNNLIESHSADSEVTAEAYEDLGFPEPLPEIPEVPTYSRFLPYVTSVAGVLILLAGGFIYLSNDSNLEPITELNEQRAKLPGRFEPIEVKPSAPEIKAESPASSPIQFFESPIKAESASPEIAPAANPPAPTVFVRSKQGSTMYYGGPGLGYPILGVLNPNLKYSIAESKNEWFKIQNDESNVVYGWIRDTTVDYVAVEKDPKGNNHPQ